MATCPPVEHSTPHFCNLYVPQLPERHAELAGGCGAVPAGFVQGLENLRTFVVRDFFYVGGGFVVFFGRGRVRGGAKGGRGDAEVFGGDFVVFGKGAGALQQVFQFADVAGEAVLPQGREGIRGEGMDGAAVAFGQPRKQVPHQVGMSSMRSRSGGTGRVRTLMRKYRSWRKRALPGRGVRRRSETQPAPRIHPKFPRFLCVT